MTSRSGRKLFSFSTRSEKYKIVFQYTCRAYNNENLKQKGFALDFFTSHLQQPKRVFKTKTGMEYSLFSCH